MKWKTWAPAVAAVVLGGAAAKIARDSMHRGPATPATATKVVRVVMVKSAVPAGQEVTPGSIELGAITGTTPPPNTFTDLAAVSGRIAMAPLFPGQAIFEGVLAPKGSAAGLAAMVPPGMRAITIKVDEMSSLGGMLTPGCRVDVVSTMSNGDRDTTSARSVVQNVLVQAVGQKLTNVRPPTEDADGKKLPEPRNEPYRSVTLVVTPREAQTLQLISTGSPMTLVLRGPGDDAQNDDAPVTFAELMGKAAAQDAPAPVMTVAQPQPETRPSAPEVEVATTPLPTWREPTKRVVELIRGAGMTKVEFEIRPRPVVAGDQDLFKLTDERPEQ